MKVLVATRATQGLKVNDLSNCVTGELVWMIDPCPQSRRKPNGPCPCGRSFSGLSSGEYTTTAEVREVLGLTRGEYESAMRASFDDHGWCPCREAHSVPDLVDQLMRLAQALPVGSIVGRRLGELTVRAHLRG